MALAPFRIPEEVESIANNVITLIIKLNQLQQDNKQIVLNITPPDPFLVILDIVGGTSQAFGDDFTIIGNILSWDGFALETILAKDDIVRITYPI